MSGQYVLKLWVYYCIVFRVPEIPDNAFPVSQPSDEVRGLTRTENDKLCVSLAATPSYLPYLRPTMQRIKGDDRWQDH